MREPCLSPAQVAAQIGVPLHRIYQWCADHAGHLSPGANSAELDRRCLTSADVAVLTEVAKLHDQAGMMSTQINESLVSVTLSATANEPAPTVQRYAGLVSGWRWLVLIYFALLIPLFRPDVGIYDPTGYYAWARSLLIDGDLNLANEFAFYGMDKPLQFTPTGYVHNQWAAGSAWLWLPAMTIVHGLVQLSAIWLHVAADGYSWPYVWAAALTSTLSGLGATLLIYNMARRLFSPFAALYATLGIWLATPLVFYQYHQPLMAHANDALLNALFIWCWWRARQTGCRPLQLILLGGVVAAATWVRTQNVLLLIATFFESTTAAIWLALSRRRIALGNLVWQNIWILAGFALLFAPLMFFWHSVYGAWLVNTYQASHGGSFDWRAPHWWQVLVSSDRGLLLWTPLIGVSLMGFVPLYRADRQLATLLGSSVLFQWYIISCWSYWPGGDAFGPRLWIAVMPSLGLCLAALIERLIRLQWGRKWIIAAVSALFILWNFLLMLQYSLGRVAPHGEVDLALMVKNQFTVAPELFIQVVARIQRMLATLTG